MSRVETKTPERLDAYARMVEQRANEALAELHWAATNSEMEAVLAGIVPETWEWLDATHLAGPRQIVITRYSRP